MLPDVPLSFLIAITAASSLDAGADPAPPAAVQPESPKLTETRAELQQLDAEKHSLTSSIVFLTVGDPVLIAGGVALVAGILWKGCQREGLGLCIGGGVAISLGAFFEVFGFLKLRSERKHLVRADELRALIAEEERRSAGAPASSE